MTAATLMEYTLKDLAQMAKKRGIAGWHSMRKNDLVQAIVKDEKKRTKATAARKRGTGSKATGRKAKVTAGSGRSSSQRHGRKTTATGAGRTGVRATGTRASTTRTSGSRRSTAASTKARGASKSTAKASTKSTTRTSAKSTKSAHAKSAAIERPSAVARKIKKSRKQSEQLKDISGEPCKVAVPAKPTVAKTPVRVPSNVPEAPPVVHGNGDNGKDRVVLMVRDPYWLHVHWDLSSRSIQRAQAAMAEYWHTAKPVIRLMEVSAKGTTNATESLVRDIEIHGGVNNWYIDVHAPPRGFRVEIGYLASNGRFHGLARSNSVVTPEPGRRDSLDQNWEDVAENCERIFALSGGYSAERATDELQEVLEERLRRPVGFPTFARFGVGADPRLEREQGFKLEVDAEMIIHGSTKAGAHVTFGGEPIKVRSDGSFTVRMNLPDRRQVLPVTSSSSDGMMEQTVVLAVERNTKVMEAVMRDRND